MRRNRVRLAVAACAVAAWALAAGSVVAAGGDVTISGFAFAPDTITVGVGDTVTWTNNDSVGHTATGDGFDTGTIAGGSSNSVTFDTAGTFAYHCSIHPTMNGTVVVEAGGGGSATTPPTDTQAAGATDGAHDTRLIGGPATVLLLALAALIGALGIARRLRRAG